MMIRKLFAAAATFALLCVMAPCAFASQVSLHVDYAFDEVSGAPRLVVEGQTADEDLDLVLISSACRETATFACPANTDISHEYGVAQLPKDFGFEPGAYYVAALKTASGSYRAVASTDEFQVPCDSRFLIPDEVMQEKLKGFDTNADGLLSEDELAVVETLSINMATDGTLATAKGIEFLPNLKVFNCAGSTKLAKLDVSKNLNLIDLNCSLTGLTELDLTQNPALKYLNLAGTALADSDISAALGPNRAHGCVARGVWAVQVDDVMAQFAR